MSKQQKFFENKVHYALPVSFPVWGTYVVVQ